jgi:hypothetical protein
MSSNLGSEFFYLGSLSSSNLGSELPFNLGSEVSSNLESALFSNLGSALSSKLGSALSSNSGSAFQMFCLLRFVCLYWQYNCRTGTTNTSYCYNYRASVNTVLA